MKKIISFVLITLSLSSFCFSNDLLKKITIDKIDDSIQMVQITQVPVSFKIGSESQAYDVNANINPYELNKYETSYETWLAVKLYAEENGYVFENPGQEGSNGRKGKSVSKEGSLQPVVCISFRDAIVWCNALSQLYELECCYTYKGEILKDSTESSKIDLAECNYKATGFRLPREAEWEYAARLSNDGLLASNTTTDAQEENHNINSRGTKEAGTSSPANFCGLYDMTGNVLEFCFDWFDEFYEEQKFGQARVCRGGSWSKYTPFYYTGDRYAYESGEAYNYLGFRLCRTLAEY